MLSGKISSFFLLFSLICLKACAYEVWPKRLTTIQTSLGSKDNKEFTVVFYVDNTLLWKVTSDFGDKWVDQGVPNGLRLVSNPVATFSTVMKTNLIQVFVQASDGQVYSVVQSLFAGNTTLLFGDWFAISPEKPLPFNSTYKIEGKDPLTAITRHGVSYVFTRSWTNGSKLYCSKTDSKGQFGSWKQLGGGHNAVAGDVAVIHNGFSGHFEAFMIAEHNGYVHYTWERNGHKQWATWQGLGINNLKPVRTTKVEAAEMSSSWTNGRTEVFVLSRSQKLYHIWQTTCDTVDNIWGYCTWGRWNLIDKANKVPTGTQINALRVGRNLFKGLEIFTVGKDSSLYHVWQASKGASWGSWAKVNRTTDIAILPHITREEKGWWLVYTLNTRDELVAVSETGKIYVEERAVTKSSNITVNAAETFEIDWVLPDDEVSRSDWIGVYPKGAPNHKFVNYCYINGGKNPGKQFVPDGFADLFLYLPQQTYEVRYFAGNTYYKELQTTFHVVSDVGLTSENNVTNFLEGFQVGLGQESEGFHECELGSGNTMQAFEKVFNALKEKNYVMVALRIGQAFSDLADTMQTCQDSELGQSLKNAYNMIKKCLTEGDCRNMVENSAGETYNLSFTNRNELSMDLDAAANSINLLGAYKQAGLSVGRMVQAVTTMNKL